MFLSDVFAESFVNVTQTPVELYDTDGSKGAALGAGIGIGHFSDPKDAFSQLTRLGTVEPDAGKAALYAELYGEWVALLERFANK